MKLYDALKNSVVIAFVSIACNPEKDLNLMGIVWGTEGGKKFPSRRWYQDMKARGKVSLLLWNEMILCKRKKHGSDNVMRHWGVADS